MVYSFLYKRHLLLFNLMLCISTCALGQQKHFFIELSGNYSPFLSLSEDTREIDKKFENYILAYGANAGAVLYLFRTDNSPISIGVEGNFQYDLYRTTEELDRFSQKDFFHLATSSAGLSIGIKPGGYWDSEHTREFILKGGIVFNSFVNEQIESGNFQILSTEPYGKYVGIQLNFLVGDKGSGVMLATRLWFDRNIESNVDRIFSIQGRPFNIPSSYITLKIGYRISLF